MSLILLAAPALAARVYWVAPPDELSTAAVARTLPGAAPAPLDDLVDGGAAPPDVGAIDALRRELAEARPLANEFDGELQIMARLRKAADDVHVLRSEEERGLLYEALLFEGFAVHRYFQDKLGTEGAAAPYRTGEGAAAQVASWLDAAALVGVAAPPESALPEPAQRLAYDEVQALTRSMPSSTVIVGELAKGAEVRVDGVRIDGGTGTRVRVVPGRHLLHVAVGDTFLLTQDARLKPGSDAILSAPFGPTEYEALKALVSTGLDGWAVPPAAMVPVTGAGEPVYIAVPAGDKTTLLRVDSGTARKVPIQKKEGSTSSPIAVRAAVGGGWLSTGDFLVQNYGDGASIEPSTVNAGTTALSVGAEYRQGLFVAGVAVDAQLALGSFHSLPTGEADTRVFAYPHVSVGIPWVRATLGPQFPWYFGMGLAGHVPIVGPIEAFATAQYGLPVTLPRGDDPDFVPLPLYTGWGGVAVRFD